MKIVVWGLGEYYKRYKWLIEQYDVIAITDGNKNMWGNYVDGKMIIAPQEILNFQWDYVYITSTTVKPIYNSLLSMGVLKEKIRCYYDFIDIGHRAKKTVYNLQDSPANKEMITLISQDLGVNGACRCLLLSANVYINNGYKVILASPIDGDMRNEFLKIGCTIIIDENLMISNLIECEWLANSIFLLINTLQMFYLLEKRNLDFPVIWWLHEPPYFYKCVCDERLEKINYSNLHIMPVSSVAGKAFSMVVSHVITQQLLYGIHDEFDNIEIKCETKKNQLIKFVTVGNVCEIKGIKFLIEVIDMLPEDVIRQCEFYIVGDDSSAYAEQAKEFCRVNDLPVHFMGLCNHNQTMKILGNSDVFLCSSQIESMSIAVEEAMMMRKPVIVSDTTGNAQFVYGENNGWVYKALDCEELRQTIEDCISKREQLCMMGENGRQVFLRDFEYSIFEQRMLMVAKEMSRKCI